ncbi:MAG TPA: hypothetical protein VN457_00120 [Chlamydiales bacterium]|nr:hypothetical protein [Chlamydiales bacterium]
MKKRAFSLAELLIAFSLFALIVSCLFGLLHYNLRVSNQMKEIHATYEQTRRVELRLQELFTSLSCKPKKGRYFFSHSKANKDSSPQLLVFSFHRKVAEMPLFSGFCLAKLYLENGGLFLAMWPNPLTETSDPPPLQKEKLFEHVSAIKIEFWASPTTKGSPDETIPTNRWVDRWLKEYETLPTLVRITLTTQLPGKEAHTVSFSFVIPNNIKAIVL